MKSGAHVSALWITLRVIRRHTDSGSVCRQMTHRDVCGSSGDTQRFTCNRVATDPLTRAKVYVSREQSLCVTQRSLCVTGKSLCVIRPESVCHSYDTPPPIDHHPSNHHPGDHQPIARRGRTTHQLMTTSANRYVSRRMREQRAPLEKRNWDE